MADIGIEYCDLVMKGGITSGIVYPNAVLALTERYTFKNIGGTSAGAIAAAATAAAALGERRRMLAGSSAGGFPELQLVADQLRKRGFILSLFQPAAGARAAFKLITTLTAKLGVLRTLLAALRAILAAAPMETVGAVAALLGLAWLLGGGSGIAAAALPALLCALIVGAVAGALRIGRALQGSSMGMCPGTARKHWRGKSSPALSDWLHQVLQRLSGQTDRPLLFEDLWTAPRHPDEPGGHAITLEMITTGISHHEPRSLPLESSSFWFRAEELEELVPKSVVDWMVAEDVAPIQLGDPTFHRLPERGRLPVIVAARMSLSFPLLISAVRLYEPDWGARPAQQEEQALVDAPATPLEATEALATGGGHGDEQPVDFRACWFSDGGIGSNFPIHLFDAPLPRWPTFAIDLVYSRTAPIGSPPSVFLPTENNQGWQRRFEAIERRSGLAQVVAFLGAIVGTMQNWRDLLQARAPGHRDRIVRVPLTEGEGGMNLDMDQEVLDRVASKGAEAGHKLVAQFSFGNHWWVRWRNAVSATERFTIGLARAAEAPPTPSYADARSSALEGSPPPPSYRMTAEQQRDAQARLRRMIDDGLLWDDTDPDLTKGAPRPLPQLRIVPTF